MQMMCSVFSEQNAIVCISIGPMFEVMMYCSQEEIWLYSSNLSYDVVLHFFYNTFWYENIRTNCHQLPMKNSDTLSIKSIVILGPFRKYEIP